MTCKSRKTIAQILAVLFLLIFGRGISFCQAIPESERNALIALYNSTNGDNWEKNDHWLGNPGSECRWYGVWCDDGHVTMLDLTFSEMTPTENLMTGTIPPELGNLKYLKFLYLPYQNLSGTIPAELGDLKKLEQLFLYGNDLNGSIPSELGNLKNLEYLGLSDNNLSGSIPSELGNLTNLIDLNLGNNKLSGEIPSSLADLDKLTSMNLSRNEFSGSIRPKFEKLKNLESLDLSQNLIAGDIPFEFANLVNIKSLNLDSNNLTGTIPAELGNLKNLGGLDLGDNQLTGTIPAEFSKLTNLVALNLDKNQLTVPIPAEIGNLKNLRRLDLGENQLTGTIPSVLTNLTGLEYLSLSKNKLSGPIPAEIGNLKNIERLELDENQLNGPIPAEIGNLINLKYSQLNNNQFTGRIPAELGSLNNLVWILLNDNKLTGAIPSELMSMSSLGYINLCNNGLSTENTDLRDFLNSKQRDGVDWESCQIDSGNERILNITPVHGTAESNFTIWGVGYTSNTQIIIRVYIYPDKIQIGGVSLLSDSAGEFSTPYEPTSLEVGEYLIQAEEGVGEPKSNEKTYKIFDGPVPNIGMDPLEGPQGTEFKFFGDGFTPGGTATLTLQDPNGNDINIWEINIDQDGGIEYFLEISDDAPIGEYTWWAVNNSTDFRAVEMKFPVHEKGSSLTPATPVSPGNHVEIESTRVIFEWSHPYSDEYELIIKDEAGNIVIQKEKTTAKSIAIDLCTLEAGKNYKWTVVVHALGTTAESVESFFTYNGGQGDITPPTLVFPGDNAILSKQEYVFRWSHDQTGEYQLFLKNSKDSIIYKSDRIREKEMNINLMGDDFQIVYGENYKWYVHVYQNGLFAKSVDHSFVLKDDRDDDAILRIKVPNIENSGVKKVALYNNNSWEEISSKNRQWRVKTLDEKTGIAIFDREDMYTYFDGRNEIKRIDLLDDYDNILGHISFEYFEKNFENGSVFDLVLRLHNDLETNYEKYEKWGYYKNKNEKPVSMIIPPGKKNNKGDVEYLSKYIDNDKKPVLFVHGVSGVYPYFKDIPAAFSEVCDDDDSGANNCYNPWQFYYPFDGEIETSGKMLAEAISDILDGNCFDTKEYSDRKVHLIAHSMGGLVTRSYMQSELYKKRETIDKFAMFGTPNHGSYIAYRMYHKDFDTSGLWFYKDNEAPAYKEMSPGSKFIFDLNTSGNIFPNKREDGIVVAGIKDSPLLLPHQESAGQDDGVVASSSASMLQYGVPLIIVEKNHKELREELPLEIVRSFLSNELNFDENLISPSIDYDGKEDHSATEVTFDEGIMEFKIIGDFEYLLGDELHISFDSNNQIRFGDLDGFDKHKVMRLISSESNIKEQYYFSLDKYITHQIGFNIEEGPYELLFYYCSPETKKCYPYCKFIDLPFNHLQTTMAVLNFGDAEAAIASAKNSIPKNEKSNQFSIQQMTNYNKINYYIDSTVNSAVFFLHSRQNENLDLFDNHDMKIKTPSGVIVNQEVAQNHQDITFVEDIAEGFAYYFVKNPELGDWLVEYNSEVDVSVDVPIVSSVDVAITIPEQKISASEDVSVEVNVPQVDRFDKALIVAELYYQSPIDRTWSNLRAIHMNQKEDGTGYTGVFTPKDTGVYRIDVDFTCSYEDESIARKSMRYIQVAEDLPNDPPGTGFDEFSADAGPDNNVLEESLVFLEGTAHNAGGEVTFLWIQIDGPPVELAGAITSQASFTAPQVGEDGDTLTFQLTVTDTTGTTATDTCTVHVENDGPGDDNSSCFIHAIAR